jgi:hypothetical protein
MAESMEIERFAGKISRQQKIALFSAGPLAGIFGPDDPRRPRRGHVGAKHFRNVVFIRHPAKDLVRLVKRRGKRGWQSDWACNPR